ncbi:SDR family oxidoreductase [Arachidicoccus ginsenosidivorans]|jgi:NAD(P)-dependent dehydrogenase (short-subunit alcohol dehydrogenase family)|uniref:SDR family oxidoreductase n=1 Tax=Arachidicoccus ginsenosidivorans TaxID=496057 RepID=A0A5B8VN99_9BACT|nr:SDR family oxidoreductase [Arachidicoccus ginsenosidivorans]QEC72970.1 SDR family oxidoreductase [Arachidicoccus ginsenosidivorans]
MESKVWFITGSSKGLGKSLTLAILNKGDQVIATARRLSDLDYLDDYPAVNILKLKLDVKDTKKIHQAVSMGIDHFGQIDVLVNNAGFGITGAAESFSDDQVRDQLETNLYAPIELSRAVIPHMRRQGSGHILQISSIGGRVASTGLSIYQAAKFGLSGFSEALHKEVAPLGITVMAIEPGGIKTEWSGSSMSYADSPEVYHAVQSRISFFKNGNFVPVGDPDKMATVLMDLIDHPQPPVHLVLGSDAVGILQNGLSVRTEELKQWLSVSVSTDADQDEQINFIENQPWAVK